MESKICGHCKKRLPLEDFYKFKRTKHNRHTTSWMCRECNKAYQAEYRKAFGPLLNEQARRRRAPQIKINKDSRFLRHVKQEGDCWLWEGPISQHGYPRYSHEMASGWAHRRWKGPVPKYAHYDWTCGNQLCVNPNHLRLKEASRRRLEVA